MEGINIKTNSPEDIERVEEVMEETKAVLSSMGNNSNEWDQITAVRKEFEAGLGVEETINKLRAMPFAKQQGGM